MAAASVPTRPREGGWALTQARSSTGGVTDIFSCLRTKKQDSGCACVQCEAWLGCKPPAHVAVLHSDNACGMGWPQVRQNAATFTVLALLRGWSGELTEVQSSSVLGAMRPPGTAEAAGPALAGVVVSADALVVEAADGLHGVTAEESLPEGLVRMSAGAWVQECRSRLAPKEALVQSVSPAKSTLKPVSAKVLEARRQAEELAQRAEASPAQPAAMQTLLPNGLALAGKLFTLSAALASVPRTVPAPCVSEKVTLSTLSRKAGGAGKVTNASVPVEVASVAAWSASALAMQMDTAVEAWTSGFWRQQLGIVVCLDADFVPPVSVEEAGALGASVLQWWRSSSADAALPLGELVALADEVFLRQWRQVASGAALVPGAMVRDFNNGGAVRIAQRAAAAARPSPAAAPARQTGGSQTVRQRASGGGAVPQCLSARRLCMSWNTGAACPRSPCPFRHECPCGSGGHRLQACSDQRSDGWRSELN